MLLNQKQKPKLIVYIGESQKMFFEADFNPEKVPKEPKSAQKDPNFGPIKN